jgi:hypothetical protein
MKCPLAGTNKRFLINTIKNTLPSHKEQDHEQKEGSKEPGKSQDQKEASGKKYRSHSYKRSLHSSRGSAGCSPPRKRTSRTSRDKCDPRPSRRWDSRRASPAQHCTCHWVKQGRQGGWPAGTWEWLSQWVLCFKEAVGTVWLFLLLLLLLLTGEENFTKTNLNYLILKVSRWEQADSAWPPHIRGVFILPYLEVRFKTGSFRIWDFEIV